VKGWGNCPILNVKHESWSNAKLVTNIQPVSNHACVIFFFFLKRLGTGKSIVGMWKLHLALKFPTSPLHSAHTLVVAQSFICSCPCRIPYPSKREILTESLPRIWTLDSETCMHFWTFFSSLFFIKLLESPTILNVRKLKIKNLRTQLVFITQLTKGNRPIGRAFFARGISPGQKWWWTFLGREISCSQWEGQSMHSKCLAFYPFKFGGGKGFFFSFFPGSQCIPFKFAMGFRNGLPNRGH